MCQVRHLSIERRVMKKLFRSKPVPVPTELDLQLVDALQAVTECVEEHEICSKAASEGREVLERAKTELGLRTRV